MAESFYDEIEIEDMTFDSTLQLYHFPCPCGDRFEISLDDLRDGEEVAVCPSCSLMIKVIFEVVCRQFKAGSLYQLLCSGYTTVNVGV
jgi:diphthamide biosynthesis protein 3